MKLNKCNLYHKNNPIKYIFDLKGILTITVNDMRILEEENEKYLKDIEFIIIVYDIGNLDSFNEVQSKMENIKRLWMPFYLVGNKSDLSE